MVVIRVEKSTTLADIATEAILFLERFTIANSACMSVLEGKRSAKRNTMSLLQSELTLSRTAEQ